MLFAVPFTVLTSRADLGRALRSRGWLLTPEETRQPPELAAAAAARAQPPAAPVDFEPLAVPPRSPLAMLAEAPVYLSVRAGRRRLTSSV
jgi:membrane glycosyltransferase